MSLLIRSYSAGPSQEGISLDLPKMIYPKILSLNSASTIAEFDEEFDCELGAEFDEDDSVLYPVLPLYPHNIPHPHHHPP